MEDIVIISAGEQVPSDMEVIDGKVEANEALLTGESDLMKRKSAIPCFLEVSLLRTSLCPCYPRWCRKLCCENHPRS